MAGGDYSETTWVNNSSPYINQTNLNNIEDKITELDENFRRDKSFNFGTYKKYMYQRNTKPIEDFRDETDFSATGATLSGDMTNTIMNVQSLKVLEPNNTSGYVTAEKTFSSTLDLTKFIDGGSSSTSDIILIIFYVSDVTKLDNVFVSLGDDSSNYYYIGYSAGALSNGWNIGIPQKSDFTMVGSPGGWNSIDYINCEWASKSNAQNEYVSFQWVQLVREDSDYSGYGNPFQLNDGSSYSNLFNIIQDYYVLYNDARRNEVGFMKVEPENDAQCLSLNYDDCRSFSAKFQIQCVESGELPSITWYVDSDNYIEVYVTSDDLVIYMYESAAGTTSNIDLNTSLNVDDIATLIFEKDGSTIRAIFESGGTITVVEDQTSLTTDEGSLYAGGTSSNSYGIILDYIITSNQGLLLPEKKSWIKRKQVTEEVASSTTMQNDDELYFYLESNSLYRIEAVLTVTGNSTAQIKCDWELTGSAAVVANNRKCRGMAPGDTDVTDCNMKTSIHNITTDVPYGIEGTSGFITEEFFIRTFDAYGKIQFRWAQVSSNATATQVTSSSYLVITKF